MGYLKTNSGTKQEEKNVVLYYPRTRCATLKFKKINFKYKRYRKIVLKHTANKTKLTTDKLEHSTEHPLSESYSFSTDWRYPYYLQDKNDKEVAGNKSKSKSNTYTSLKYQKT